MSRHCCARLRQQLNDAEIDVKQAARLAVKHANRADWGPMYADELKQAKARRANTRHILDAHLAEHEGNDQ